MSTSTPFESKSSYERHFDDMVDSRPLLFRLHDLKPKMPATLFDAELTTLLAARYAPKSKGGVLDLLKCLDETSSPTLDEASVAKHATLWKERSKESEPSEFISLTFNVFWVLWEWKRRMSHRSPHLLGSRDDFHLIVLKSSDLHRPSKLVTEILNREIYKDGYRFARSAEEVIVPKFIRGKGAILGTTSMSQLQDFVPSWWKEQLESFEKIPRSENEASGPSDRAFTSFQSKLKPPADDGDRARQSLRFALALLAPFIVSNLQRLADIETIVESTGREIDCPQAGGVNIKVDPSDNGTSLGKRKAEQGERSGSLETGSLLAGTSTDGDSPRNGPPEKGRRLSEDEQFEPPRSDGDNALVGSIGAGPSKSARLPEWKYVCVLAADVWWEGMKEPEESRRDFERKCTTRNHARELLERYRCALGKRPKDDDLKILRRVMDKYELWASETTNK